MKERFNTLAPFRQVLLLLAIGILSYAVMSMLLNLTLSSFFPDAMQSGLKEQMTEHPIVFMILQILPLEVGFLFIPSFIYLRFSRNEIRHLNSSSYPSLVWSFLLFLAAFLLLPLLSEINFQVVDWMGVGSRLLAEKELADLQLVKLIGDVNSASYLVAVVLIGIVTGIAEELAFRRFLLHHLLKTTHKLGLSLLVSSLIFALLHFNSLQFLPLFTFGLVLGLMYYVSKSVLPGIIVHAFNNMINIYWLASDSYPSWMNKVDLKTTIPSIILLTGLLIYLYRRERFTAL